MNFDGFGVRFGGRIPEICMVLGIPGSFQQSRRASKQASFRSASRIVAMSSSESDLRTLSMTARASVSCFKLPELVSASAVILSSHFLAH